MAMKHFNWMVYDHVDRRGIWFYGTQTHVMYVLYWNPISIIRCAVSDFSSMTLGFFPLSSKHIKFD